MRSQGRAVLAVCLAAAAGEASTSPRAARTIDLGPFYAAAVGNAVDGASRRLKDPECRRIFADFRDGSGATLQVRLDAIGVPAETYLGRLIFTDGFGHRGCSAGHALALTSPGSRVVYVCGPRFQRAHARRPAETEVAVLHEALHTLGLGENPPDSLEITRQVGARCVPER